LDNHLDLRIEQELCNEEATIRPELQMMIDMIQGGQSRAARCGLNNRIEQDIARLLQSRSEANMSSEQRYNSLETKMPYTPNLMRKLRDGGREGANIYPPKALR
jgi:hypothetical protein